jgi:diguanylate cyclase (GGDEF)-like protein/PAS domain S-box-containing protein
MQTLIDIKNLIPHGYCLSWSPVLLWMHVVSDVIITLSYYFIPLSLLYFIRKREDLPYPWLITMFALFIVACGTTHLLSVVTIWIPLYWLDGYLKVFTALISIATAFATVLVIPLALKLPSPEQLQAANNQLNATIDAIPDLLFEVDSEGRYYSYHQPHFEPLVLNHESFIGKKLIDILPKAAAETCLFALEDAKNNGWSRGRQFKLELPDGIRWFELSVSVKQVNESNEPHFVVLSREITERKLAETEQRIASIAFESQESMVITDVNLIILRVNNAYVQMSGYSNEELIGKKVNLIKSGHHNNDFYNSMWKTINATGSWQGEIWDRRKNGEIYPKWLTITVVLNEEGKATHYVGNSIDITERKTNEEYIQQLAFYDYLTRLPNRRLFYERLEHATKNSTRNSKKIAILMLDLDKFKAVNDTFGHAAGDELLLQVANRIKVHLREQDTVARLGGDEFIVLLEEIQTNDDASIVALALIKALNEPFNLIQSDNVEIGTSVGISIFPDNSFDVEILMNQADKALYQAKNNGRGCLAYFSEIVPASSQI